MIRERGCLSRALNECIIVETLFENVSAQTIADLHLDRGIPGIKEAPHFRAQVGHTFAWLIVAAG